MDTLILTNNINIVIALIEEINDNISKGNINFGNIINLIDNLSLLSNNINTLNNINISLEEYNEKLSLALNSFEAKDYILFNDILQYELKPVLEYWMENIN